jgi:chemotaxis protein methyltransferase CheR
MTIASLTHDDFEFVRALVRDRSAIQLEGKQYLVETRLQTLARRRGHESASTMLEQLRRSGCHELQHLVVEAMTTNETSFFRDLKPFEALAKIVLPERIQTKHADRVVRVWCAASSTGQEPYTVAMVWNEHFGALPGWRIEIYASDLSTEVLERAREGKFSQLEVNRGLPAPLLVKYFTKHGTEWHLKDDIRKLVQFRQINLIEPLPPMPPLDIVFLRNVLIYFDVKTKQDILAKVRRQMRPDGYLFLGGAETPLGLDDAFERIPYERSGCYRIRKATAAK